VYGLAASPCCPLPRTQLSRFVTLNRELANTPEFAHAQRQRKKVEALFAELKNQIGLRRLRLRRLKFVREQFFLAAAAQNIKRLVRFLGRPTTPHWGSHRLTEVSEEIGDTRGSKEIPSTPFFNTHRRLHVLTVVDECYDDLSPTIALRCRQLPGLH